MNILICVIRVIGSQLNLNLSIEFGCGVANNCIKLIELHKCTSREQEINSEKSSPQLSFDSQGNIKVSKQSAVADCLINGEIKLRAAFTRRSLALRSCLPGATGRIQTYCHWLDCSS